jgi:hypothetical protein
MMWGLDDLLDDVSKAHGRFGDVGDDIQVAFASAIEKCDTYIRLIKNNDMYLAAHILDPWVKTTNIREQYREDANDIIKRV